MKNALSIVCIILLANFSSAQDENYAPLWKQVEEFEMDGLPKSALKIVETISNHAKKDKNTTQDIKCLIYKSKFALVLEEDAQLKIINDFKTEIYNSEFPKKNILESLLANLYWQYFKQNRYKFYNRTKTTKKVDNIDFRTWDLQTIFSETHMLFQASLVHPEQLQKESLNNYDDLLVLAKNSKTYRPTLFDFLNYLALDFYKTTESSITKPAYKFEIDNPEFLAEADTFSELKMISQDSTSLQLHALKIYQNLIQFHIKDDNPFALSDANIQRLKFIKQHATFSNKETLFLNTLKSESSKIANHEASALYDFEIASTLYQEGLSYQHKTNDGVRWNLKEAIRICGVVMSKFPETLSAKKCTTLKHQIERQTLQIKTEDFLPIQTNNRLLITYKNIDTLYFKTYKLSEKDFKKFSKLYQEDEQLSFIKKLDVQNNWQITLRNEGDFQTHSAEILLPKLDNGRYLIFASTTPDNKGATAFRDIQATNLAVVESSNANHHVFQIINRNNGEPIANALVSFRFHQNNTKSPGFEELKSNSRGEIYINKNNDWYRNVSIEVRANKDFAVFGDYYIGRLYKTQKDEVTYKSFLFTDRSIYRPGQTVYFKGIAMKTDDGKSEVLANHKMTATLYNPNNQELQELGLVTNEFGSVSGEFMLPHSGLNGQYYIEFDSETEDIYTDYYFSVEEYKRPKFETKFNPITDTFKVNDSVTIKGNALAYAGSNITDAKVVYRVHRNVQYPHWYYWRRPSFYSEPQEIIHGETLTNNKGEFEITFKALPDQSIDKRNLPVFNYEITADITDLNGETRSATTTVNVGYHALIANLSIENKIDKTNKVNNISIDTKNLNGEFVPAKGTVKIYKLKAPNAVLRKRSWEAPDYQEFTKETFKNLFPHDAYKDEHDANNWEKGALVFEKNFDTNSSTKLGLGNINRWKSGQYIITLESKDKFGQMVKDQIKTSLFSDNDKTLADNQLFSIKTNKPNYKAGENAIITFATAAQNLNVTVTIEKNHEIVDTYILKLNNNKKSISVPVASNDIGGFAVNYSFAAFNSFQSGVEIISVPYPNTQLDIETITFRDKLQPGQEETWSFKIKGLQGEKVSSELLASMYDASLDQFTSHSWQFNPINQPLYYSYNQSNANRSFGTTPFKVYLKSPYYTYAEQHYDTLNWFGFYFGNQNIRIRGMSSISQSLRGQVAEVQVLEDNSTLNEVVVTGYSAMAEESQDDVMIKGENSNLIPPPPPPFEEEKPNFNNIQIRKNLQETAFFFPKLQTDKDGNVSFSFTTPEALTQWKLQLLAHNKILKSTTKTLTVVTQKELMVIPNAPRFLREGDQIAIGTKIANLSEKELSGQAFLILTDAISGKDITANLLNATSSETSERVFVVDAKGNTQVSWNLNIPNDVDAVQYKIIATAGDFSDGEQNALPVLNNRMLVTETLPMWIRSNESKTFTLDKLKTNTSTTLKNHKLTLEITSNPAWYAVQALPYLMEYPFECNEQTFSRFYANALASHIVNSNPRIQEVFNQWKNSDALISNLEKNQDLKSILIQETPWLRDAQSETEQKKRIALLFDLNKMTNELQSAIRKLENNQMSSGGWAWFHGGRKNRYITQHIISGFGHLKKLGVDLSRVEDSKMITKAIQYLDAEFIQEYKDLKKYDSKINLSEDHLSYSQLHYLYMRSFFLEVKKSHEIEDITAYYQTQIKNYWLKRPLYAKGLMALISKRFGDITTATKILKSLKENSITSDELGMYWKENTGSFYWYQAPIETQALMIETFSEIDPDTVTIDNLKIWLLKNKQTNRWKTTKATTEAIYALLLQGSDWLSVTDMVDVVVGNKPINPSKLEGVKVEAGTGYYKTSWTSSEITADMASVTITKKGDGIAWGSLYWQYFEDLDNISSSTIGTETPLTLKKKLFLKKNTDLGEEILEITPETFLKVGDLVRVRIELRSDRPMEFIHMKDMRAAGLEPVNVLSQYKWQDGLGYYESTKDASTNFFFDYLPKGIFVFEYDLRVNNAGNMSNGLTTIQSMYAPEFISHSEGNRISVE